MRPHPTFQPTLRLPVPEYLPHSTARPSFIGRVMAVKEWLTFPRCRPPENDQYQTQRHVQEIGRSAPGFHMEGIRC